MKFMPRAALLAAVTFCAGAIADAAPLEAALSQDVPVQAMNNQDNKLVPAPEVTVAAIPRSAEIVQPLPAADEDEDFATLSAAVAAQDAPALPDSELHCLAVGVYYESKGEPLAGQLAVAEVILNRTTSGRFPRTVCSVIKQRGQFSFVRGGQLPKPPVNAQWRKAIAVAQVAQKDLWDSPAANALYFHARYVSPGWKRARVGTIGNHVFYR
ncbi:MAG: cell wall hydrolase [Sphingomonadales bacterium]|nr:MAG: cell wall hydrolase [Sphingomonadales bacterium]